MPRRIDVALVHEVSSSIVPWTLNSMILPKLLTLKHLNASDNPRSYDDDVLRPSRKSKPINPVRPVCCSRMLARAALEVDPICCPLLSDSFPENGLPWQPLRH